MNVEHQQLSTGRMLLGLAAAAVAGLCSYVVLELGVTVLRLVVATVAFGHEWKEPQVFSTATFYLFFGLPVALILSVAIGFPVWKQADSRPLRSPRDASKIGAVVGAGIGILFVLLDFLSGLRTYFGPGSFDSYTYGYRVTRDGLPTLLGWLFQVLSVLYFTIAGAIGGLAARWVAHSRAVRG